MFAGSMDRERFLVFAGSMNMEQFWFLQVLLLTWNSFGVCRFYGHGTVLVFAGSMDREQF